MRSVFAYSFLAILIAFRAADAAPHPLTPLSADEIRAAARILRGAPKFPAGGQFSVLTLAEPPKDQVLAKSSPPRRAFAVIYDHAGDHTFEAVANLNSNAVESWKEIPGAEPAIDGEDSTIADRIVRSDPRWEQAMRAHGIRDTNRVVTMSWTAGYFALPGTEQGRVARVVPYYAAGENLYAHPVEGVVAHVNLTTRKIIDFLDIDRDVPVSRENDDLGPRATRPPISPLLVSEPNGPGFQIVDGEVRWEKWHFRYALHPREGVVLYTVGYEDGGKVRPVMYRGSLSEMVVPYGDPTAGWFFRNSFDVGELGLGITASPLRPGIDCPANCSVYDAVVAEGSGEPRVIPGAVAIFERDGGIEWKHADNTRRSRELVVAYWSQPGNYEYGFEWVFHQDGTLEMRVLLSGIMAVKGVSNKAHDMYSHLVAPNVAAPHHEHFFAFRLDMDVDGQQNRVKELNTVALPAGPNNPYGGGFTMEESTLKTESEAQRQMNLASSRRWLVESATTNNSLGHPTAYLLMPGENSMPFALPDSWVRKRAGFLNAHLWVTPFSETEHYAAGDYPNQSRGGDGLPKWTSANRALDGKDVVLWYVMGITHNPRPEDWPVMPVYQAGFKLIPVGFFSSNPAMDLPIR